MNDAIRVRHDVVVVGARAAGAATAMLLARLGHDVLLVDRADLPSDTISTHQIARTGVVALHRWGLLPAVLASGAPAIRQVSFDSGDEIVTRAVKLKSDVDCLVAPRRYVLDTLLAEAAGAAEATVRLGIAVAGVHRDDSGRVTGVHGHDRRGDRIDVAGRLVIGADGLTSRIARAVAAPVVEDLGAPGATQYAYYSGLPWPAIEFVTAPGAFAGVFPTNDGEAGIWICTPAADARAMRRATGLGSGSSTMAFEAQLRRAAPRLCHRLRRAQRTSPVRGMLRAPNLLRRAYGPGWALVGDAGYHRDPLTGHGISDAFRDAESLAVALDAILRGRADEAEALAGYERRRDAALREIFDLTRDLVAYPPVPEFIELNKRLGAAIDTEAAALAAQPVPGEQPLIPV